MRYFGYRSAGHFNGHLLLSDQQIFSVLSALNPATTEAFASMQTYDDSGCIVSAPIYADLDGESALDDTRYIVYLFGECLNVVPRVWYSGNKGFHLVLPYEINHEQAHLVVKNFILDISRTLKSLDHKVYRTKSLFRIPNYRASRPDFYKVEITQQELMSLSLDDIQQIATCPRIDFKSIPIDIDKLKENQMFCHHLEQSINNIPKYERSVETYINNIDVDMMPCIKAILESPPRQGTRNHCTFLLAKFYKSCGVPVDTALAITLSQPHFKEYNDHADEVIRTFNSVYKSPAIAKIGCKSGFDAELLRRHCSPLCPFNDDFDTIGFSR